MLLTGGTSKETRRESS